MLTERLPKADLQPGAAGGISERLVSDLSNNKHQEIDEERKTWVILGSYMDEQYQSTQRRGEYHEREAERRRQEENATGATDLTNLSPSTTITTAGKWARKYRSKYEIIAAIIESASMQAKNKMHLMFDAYLSYTQIKHEYIPLLLDAELLLEHSDGYFTATERGLKFLHAYGEIRGIVEAKTVK